MIKGLVYCSTQHFLITPCSLDMFFHLSHFFYLLTFRNFLQIFYFPSLPVKFHQKLNLIRLRTLSFYKICHECFSIFFYSSAFSLFHATNNQDSRHFSFFSFRKDWLPIFYWRTIIIYQLLFRTEIKEKPSAGASAK